MSYTEHASETYKSMILISVEAMKSLLLINGGAVLAVLTYLGAVNNSALASQASVPLGFFVLGVILNIITFVFSYLTQFALFNETLHAKTYTGPKHQTFLYSALICLVLCLLSFVGGCVFSILLLSRSIS